MGYRMPFKELCKIISETCLIRDGDRYEKKYWQFLEKNFQHYQVFWRCFIVPLTKRIYKNIRNNKVKIRFRKGISKDLEDIASIHYSIFLNLVYSNYHLQNLNLTSFEDFYLHLVSACELVEEFLVRIYLLYLECSQKCGSIKRMVEEYKWKNVKQQALDEYYEGEKCWNEYKKFNNSLRKYRNRIIHTIYIGKLIKKDKKIWVPKKENIENYKRWSDIFAVARDENILKKDFIEMEKQMKQDIRKLEKFLNNLWEKPILDLSRLFFEKKNKILLRKYNLELI